MTPRRILATIVFIFALSSVTQAATLYTPPIAVAPENNLGIDCRVANVDKVAREITIALIGFDGSIVVEREPELVPPLNSRGIQAFVAESVREVFCQITVEGPRQSVRGGMCIFGEPSPPERATAACVSAPVPAE